MEKIIIEDKNCLIRVGIKEIVEIQYPNAQVFAVDAMNSLTLEVQTQDWDLIIADLELPLYQFTHFLKKIKCLKPQVPVLVLSSYNPHLYATRILKEGVTAYLNKSTSAEELLIAIQKCLYGKKHIHEEVFQKLVDGMSNENDPLQLLSNKELEIFIAIAFGKSVEELSGYFNMSVPTLKACRTKILHKLSIYSESDITDYAISHHFFSEN